MVIVLAGILVSSCGAPSFSREQQARLDKTITGFMKDHHFPGAVVGAWSPGVRRT